MHDIVDLLRAFFQCILLLLGGGIGTLKENKDRVKYKEYQEETDRYRHQHPF